MGAILGGFFLICMWLTMIAVGLKAGGFLGFLVIILLIALIVTAGRAVISFLGFLWKIIFPDS